MSGTLKMQVMQAEQRCVESRRRLGDSVARLEKNVREELTSTGVLLLAGGVGFVAADVIAYAPGRKQVDRTPAALPRLLANAVSILALVRAVLATIQAAHPTTRAT